MPDRGDGRAQPSRRGSVEGFEGSAAGAWRRDGGRDGGGLFLGPASVAAAGRDTDGGGLTNAFEVDRSRTSPTRRDTDRDGIPDGREDPDRDGLTNRFEQAAGTHPRRADSDGDGIRDGREDPDHDGLSNRREQQVGTNP